MCRCISKTLCKLFQTIILTVVLGICVWICFDVYVVSDNFVESKYQVADPQQVITTSLTLEPAKINLQDGFYDEISNCYFTTDDTSLIENVYYKINDSTPYVYKNITNENNQYEWEKVDINCVQQSLIDDKGYYFNGLNLTVFWVGICGCVIYLICLLCIWICGWKDKKQYVSSTA